MDKQTEKLKVRCPSCREWTKWSNNPFKPFCSKECKMRDLGQWATESYRIPAGAGRAAEEDKGTGAPRSPEE